MKSKKTKYINWQKKVISFFIEADHLFVIIVYVFQNGCRWFSHYI